MSLLSIVPLPYRIVIGFAAFLVVLLSGFVMGVRHDQHRIDAMVNKSIKEGVRITQARDVVTTRILEKHLPAITRVETITETITQQVPVYVYPSDPPLGAGFRELHDAAADMRIPRPASELDAGNTVPPQDAAGTIARNYGVCNKAIAELNEWREWAREQKKVK